MPIIFLTEKRGRLDKLKGLELGAEDYITKPFDIQELNSLKDIRLSTGYADLSFSQRPLFFILRLSVRISFGIVSVSCENFLDLLIVGARSLSITIRSTLVFFICCNALVRLCSFVNV